MQAVGLDDRRDACGQEIQQRAHRRQHAAARGIHRVADALRQQPFFLEHQFQLAKLEAASRLALAKQESEVAQKRIVREHNVRHNDIIREYEQRLSDQRLSYEDQLSQMKSSKALEIARIEREGKGELEKQNRTFQQRYEQLAEKTKDRERAITQNYNREMDKMRHNYEQLNRKKS